MHTCIHNLPNGLKRKGLRIKAVTKSFKAMVATNDHHSKTDIENERHMSESH